MFSCLPRFRAPQQSPTGRLTRRLAIVSCFPVLLLAAAASAQPLQNPRAVEFEPPADHAATLEGGTPVITSYEFEIYMAGASAPFHTVSLGKPAPGPDGLITVDFSSQVTSWPLPGGTYESRVSAVGPGGTSRSDVSNQFQFASCAYSLSASTISLGHGAGSSATLTLTAPAGCAWAVSTTTTWITVVTTTGSGDGSVRFSYQANTTGAARSGSLSIAGQTVTVSQSALPVAAPSAPLAVRVVASAQ